MNTRRAKEGGTMTARRASGLPEDLQRRAAAAKRARIGTFVVFFLSGFAFANWVSRMPAVRDGLDARPDQMGLIVLVGSVGSVVAMPFAGALATKIGARLTIRCTFVMVSIGLVAAAVSVNAGSKTATALCLLFYGLGMGTCDVAMNLEAALVEREIGRAIMPQFHGGYSLGTVAGSMLGAVAAKYHVNLALHLAIVTLVCLIVIIWGTSRMMTTKYAPVGEAAEDAASALSADAPDAQAKAKAKAGKPRRSTASAWGELNTVLIGIVVLAFALTEGSANDWLSLAVTDGFSVPPALGAVALSVFLTAMTIMRFLGTRAIDRWGRVRTLRVCAVIALIGLAIFELAPDLPIAIVGVGLWGVGAALGFPVGISAASDDPMRAAARVSVVSTIGYTAFIAGPSVLGMLADHVGYRHALAAIAVPVVIGLLLIGQLAPRTSALAASADADGEDGAASLEQ